MWKLRSVRGFQSNLKKYQKQHPQEVIAVFFNLENVKNTMNTLHNMNRASQLISCIRHEGNDLYAVDTRGADIRRSTKLKTTRLYIYPHTPSTTLHLLRIGDKDSQKQDLLTCRKKIETIKKGEQNG